MKDVNYLRVKERLWMLDVFLYCHVLLAREVAREKDVCPAHWNILFDHLVCFIINKDFVSS